MSWIEFFAYTAILAWVVSLLALARFHGFIMTNNNTAGRGPTREEFEAAFRKYQAQVEADIAVYTRTISMTAAHTVLGVSSTATLEEIKAAYRQLRSQHHPDRGGDAAQFQKVQAAYEQLIKPKCCPQCEGKGTIKVKRGAFIDKVQCPRCWPTKEGEK